MLKGTKILKGRPTHVTPLLVAKGKQRTWQTGAAALVGVGRRFGHCWHFRRKLRTGKLEGEKFKGNKS